LQGIQPEVRTYNTIITACNKSGKPEEGLRIYERMVAAGVKASATTYTALISAYGKQGKVEKAMEIFAGVLGVEQGVSQMYVWGGGGVGVGGDTTLHSTAQHCSAWHRSAAYCRGLVC
jgi:pentatricopeptide repeat protein